MKATDELRQLMEDGPPLITRVELEAMLDVIDAAEMFGTSHEIHKALARLREVME